MARERKYFKSKVAAFRACERGNQPYGKGLEVFKMPKGSRHPGMYAVCTHLEWLNTY